MLRCSMYVKPVGPSQDPCEPVELDATVLRGVLPLTVKDGEGNFRPVCGSPEALTTDEQCQPLGDTDPVVGIVHVGFSREELEEAIRKLGGPGAVIPMPRQDPPCMDCPQPETGEGGSGPNPDSQSGSRASARTPTCRRGSSPTERRALTTIGRGRSRAPASLFSKPV